MASRLIKPIRCRCNKPVLRASLSYSAIERIAFGASVLLVLAPIWLSGTFFVTGDGPCHTYNASVLLDWWQGKSVAFYKQFYTLNPYFDPNWWTHAWLFLLQTIVKPALAEKLFLSAYVLAFCFGFRYLLRRINPEAVFLSAIGALFCWHHLLQMGFFNYAWSLAGMFWVIAYAPGAIARRDWKAFFGLQLAWISLYSMHPIGLTFAALGVGLSLAATSLTSWRQGGMRQGVDTLLGKAAFLFASALPALLFTLHYLLRKNWHRGENDQTFMNILDALSTLTMLINMNDWEHPLVNLVVMLLLLTVGLTAYHRIRDRKWNAGDHWLLFTLLSLVMYFRQVGADSLELLMPLRLQLLPWIGLLCWAATATIPRKVRYALIAGALALHGLLLAARLPAHQAASRLVEKWTSLAGSIGPESVVMVINYDFNGTDEKGRQIGNRIWMFNHAADYIGAMKDGIIMSDNYEGLLGYFPLRWRLEGDMYNRTAIDGIGFEHRPPRVDLLGFPKRSQGRQIKYVLVLGLSDADRAHERGQELMRQLDAAYHLIGQTEDRQVLLYQLNGPG